VPDVLNRTREMTESILSAVARAIVYSTGFEVRRGMIEDTTALHPLHLGRARAQGHDRICAGG
jgi:hypothetical protein